MQAIAQAMHVKQRQRQQKAVGAGNLPARDQIERVGGEIVVRQHGALGRACGPGSIDDARRSVAIDRHLRPLIRLRGGFALQIRGVPDRHRARKLAVRDHRDGVRIGEDMRHLALAIQNVDRHEDHAQLDARDDTDPPSRCSWRDIRTSGRRPSDRVPRAVAPAGCCARPCRRRCTCGRDTQARFDRGAPGRKDRTGL